MGDVAGPPPSHLSLEEEIQELKKSGARLNCNMYIFFPGCRGSLSKKSHGHEKTLAMEQVQENDKGLEKRQWHDDMSYVFFPTKRGKEWGRRGGLFSNILS